MISRREPLLRVRHLAARIAKERKTEIQKDDKDEKWKKNEQRKWLTLGEYREGEKQSE
jgi:hypothetical protein